MGGSVRLLFGFILAFLFELIVLSSAREKPKESLLKALESIIIYGYGLAFADGKGMLFAMGVVGYGYGLIEKIF